MRMVKATLFLVAALVLASCGNLLAPAAAAVGDHKVTIDEVEDALHQFESTQEFDRLASQQGGDLIRRQFEQSYLTRLIRREVLTPKADDLGIEVTDADVADRIDQIQNDFPSEDAFKDALAQQGLNEDQLNDLVYDNLLEEKLRAEITKNAQPSDAELMSYYQAHLGDYTQMHAQHILLDDKATAQGLAKQLQSAPKNKVDDLFAQLAKKFSRDASNASKGGDLGVTKPGELVPEFQQAADQLAVGEVSDPVRTQFGFHIIRVLSRTVQPFEAVRDEIVQKVGTPAADKAWADWLRAAYEDANVRVNPRFGELDLATGQIVDASAATVPGAAVPSATPTPAIAP